MTKKKETLPALKEANLTSSAMAEHANFDMDVFDGIKLDVTEDSQLFQNDILIPKIWLVQATSELRKQKKANEGQFVDSQTGELLADEGEDLRFIVLKTFKRWHTFKIVNEKGKTKKEFVSSEIMVFGKNHDLKYQEVVDGEDLVRRQVISAYVLIERDANMGVNKPYIIDFAASSKYGGRKMISDIKTLNNKGLPAFAGWFKMSGHEENFEDGSAYVKDVSFGGFMNDKIMPFLVQCRKDLDSMENQIEIDDSDVIDAAKATNTKVNHDVTSEVTEDARI